MRTGEDRRDAAEAISEVRERLSQLAIGAGISALAIAVFWPIRGHDWLSWDDFIYITKNPHIQLGVSSEGIRWALTSFYQANWFPLTWLLWMLDYQLHGFEARAFLTTNLMLHALNSALLFAALLKLTGARGRSAFVAVVFAIHPLHVESVAWAAARKDVLSGVFWMLTLWLYASDSSSLRGRTLIAAGFAAAFAAKPYREVSIR